MHSKAKAKKNKTILACKLHQPNFKAHYSIQHDNFKTDDIITKIKIILLSDQFISNKN